MSYQMLCCNTEVINLKNNIEEEDNLPELKTYSNQSIRVTETNERETNSIKLYD